MCHDWDLRNFALGEKHWEWVTSTVHGELFFDLYLVVGKVEVEDIILLAAMVSSVVPKDVEG